jgi:hypothetical protein
LRFGVVYRLRILAGPARKAVQCAAEYFQFDFIVDFGGVRRAVDFLSAGGGERRGWSRGSMTRTRVLSIVAALLAGGALLYFYGGHEAPAGQPPLAALTQQNIGVIENAFNAAKGEVRVLVLLSPT